MLDWLLGKRLMKKILLLPILFILSACQPSELDRCIEANILNKITPENKEIIFNTYDIVLPETVEQQFKDTVIADWISEGNLVLDPTKAHTGLSRFEEWKKWALEEGYTQAEVETGLFENPKTIAGLRETARKVEEEQDSSLFNAYYKNLIDYNKEYYGLTDEKILQINATSICNAQGIY
jgi:hypothetical protein